ncbi:NAD(P)/FAD-dependent oxidoreductase [Marinisporobacter balticus]|uniref:Glycine/D-amino acid oxidase-like deaminating enzyme n=1 Tax=Marinisporobacter balticus TaxID=2018667 RepID=A0A4R2L608_9FIRM|nr:FAD-dependent oxidoreductase [Marinisporobacter balticus]TCO74615.1 glycine/D-amino acid oxidase-like deaminating enzyme [Marinisporobacter balticus]
MKLLTGNMLWTNMHKIPNQYTYLSENLTCDVLVVGAGISGALAAFYLAEAGVNTVIIDKNIIGYGSTRASTSILQYEIDTDLFELISMIGEKSAVNCFKLCEKAVYDIEKIVNTLDDDCDFSLKECFYYATKTSQVSPLQKECHLRQKYGFDVAFLDKESAKEKFSFPVAGGIYSKSGAAQINPYRFTHALISKSIKNGLKVFENTEIIDILPKENHVLLKTNNHFNIQAKKVIIATGYEGRNYIKEKIVHFLRTFTIVTKPVKNFDGWHNQCIIRDNNDPYTYIRNTGENRIIIGGEDEKIGGINSTMSNLSDHDLVSTQKYTVLLDKLKSYFPKINDIEAEYKFSGLFGITKDGLPYIGEYKSMPNCYFSLGYGANGILYSVLGGQLLKDLFLGNDRPELELFRFNR